MRLLALTTIVALAAAEAAGDGHVRVAPFLSAEEDYDDNLFSATTAPESDLVSRLTPALEAGYVSTPFSLRGRYAQTAEWFRDHPSLSTTRGRQDASLDAEYLSAGGFRLRARQDYLDTRAATEIAALTGLELGRQRARRFLSDESMAWQFAQRSELDLGYAYTDDEIVGGVRGRTHVAAAGLEQKLSPRDAGLFGYTMRLFQFAGSPDTAVHVVSLGWVRELGPRTRLRLVAGPRFSQGTTTRPEIEVSLRQGLGRDGELTLAGNATETRIVGVPGPVVAQSATLTLAGEIAHDLRVSLTPGVFRSTLDGLEATVYRAGLDVGYRVARWLLLEASHEQSLQKGILGGTGEGEIRHGTTALRFTLGAPERPRPPKPEDEGLRVPKRPGKPASDTEEPEPKPEGGQ